MTAKDKAKELILKFAFKGAQHEGEAKQFALIVVNEILKAFYSLRFGNALDDELEYWEEVKIEIEKL